MNAYKLHGQAGRIFISAICKHLGIAYTEVCRTLKDVNGMTGVIETKDGKQYRIVLEEIPPLQKLVDQSYADGVTLNKDMSWELKLKNK